MTSRMTDIEMIVITHILVAKLWKML